MERQKLVELAQQVAKEYDLPINDTFLQGSVTLAAAAKTLFDQAWQSPDLPDGTKPPRSKVAGISMSHVHQLLGVPTLRNSRFHFVDDLLVEAYHITIIRHPLEEAYLFLYLDKLRYQRPLRNVWAWKGSQHLHEVGNVETVPEFEPLDSYESGEFVGAEN